MSPSKYSAGSGYVHCVSTVDTCVDNPSRNCGSFLVGRDRCAKQFGLGKSCSYCESHTSFTKGCQHSCHACPGEANYPLWLTLTRTDDPKTTVTTTTGTTTTRTRLDHLKLHDQCDPRNDLCNADKDLVCHPSTYKCLYGTTTAKTTITTDIITPQVETSTQTSTTKSTTTGM